MFKETEALGGLDVQLIYYRGFGECRASPWVSESAKLLRFMTGVFCLAGRTQIGKVLQRAAKETRQRKVTALVFVGDAMEEELDHLGHLAGEIGLDRKSVVKGKRVSVRVDLGGRRIIKKNNIKK